MGQPAFGAGHLRALLAEQLRRIGCRETVQIDVPAYGNSVGITGDSDLLYRIGAYRAAMNIDRNAQFLTFYLELDLRGNGLADGPAERECCRDLSVEFHGCCL